MRSVIFCEGSDDLWFLAYFLNKTIGWLSKNGEKMWGLYKLLPPKSVETPTRQEVTYMYSTDREHTVAIFSCGGQDRMESEIDRVLSLSKNFPGDPIDAYIIFRDCDNRRPEELIQSMVYWFGNAITLHNNEISTVFDEVDESPVRTLILPVIIPFDEHGAVETLLLQAISDTNEDGKLVADEARNYVDSIKERVSTYLMKQRLVTKAKFSAALAITNPDHSTKLFQDLVGNPDFKWEETASIKDHMVSVIKLITGQYELEAAGVE